MAMIALKSRSQKNAFFFSLKKTYPNSFTKILIRVEKYTNTEEAYDVHPVPAKAKVD